MRRIGESGVLVVRGPGGRGGGGHQQLLVTGTLGDGVREGDTATGTGHVDGLHVARHEIELRQDLADAAAGEIPAAARISRSDAVNLAFRFEGEGLGGHGGDHRGCQEFECHMTCHGDLWCYWIVVAAHVVSQVLAAAERETRPAAANLTATLQFCKAELYSVW